MNERASDFLQHFYGVTIYIGTSYMVKPQMEYLDNSCDATEVQKRLGKTRRPSYAANEDFSQEAFTHKCGFHRSYTGAVERGGKDLTIAMIEKIATALDMSLAELFKAV